MTFAALGKEELALGLGEGFVAFLTNQVQVNGSLLPAGRVLASVEGVLAEVNPVLGRATLARSSATALLFEECVDRSVCVCILVLHNIVMVGWTYTSRDEGQRKTNSMLLIVNVCTYHGGGAAGIAGVLWERKEKG
jgi:hypothetical protein